MPSVRRSVIAIVVLLAFLPTLAVGALAEDAPLRVMSFNLRYATAADGVNSWDKRKDLLLETIRKFDPDLLGTQETLAVQADFLVENLRGHTLVGVGRDDGQRAGEYSALLYKTEHFEVVESGTFWLSETPDKPGSKSWDSSLPRIATWVKLRDRRHDGREICYLNTHWDHRGDVARRESGKLIRAWLSKHAAELPTIVTGDLNVTEKHPGIAALLSTAGVRQPLRDVYRELHSQPEKDEATFHGFIGQRSGRRIDFILASPQFTTSEAAIDYTNRDGRYPSDHFPVTAVLRLK